MLVLATGTSNRWWSNEIKILHFKQLYLLVLRLLLSFNVFAPSRVCSMHASWRQCCQAIMNSTSIPNFYSIAIEIECDMTAHNSLIFLAHVHKDDLFTLDV